MSMKPKKLKPKVTYQVENYSKALLEWIQATEPTPSIRQAKRICNWWAELYTNEQYRIVKHTTVSEIIYAPPTNTR